MADPDAWTGEVGRRTTDEEWEMLRRQNVARIRASNPPRNARGEYLNRDGMTSRENYEYTMACMTSDAHGAYWLKRWHRDRDRAEWLERMDRPRTMPNLFRWTINATLFPITLAVALLAVLWLAGRGLWRFAS